MSGRDGRDGKPGRDGRDGADGRPGESAYEAAQAAGFRGDRKEWLASLKGARGERGEQGLPGKDGIAGRDGVDGKDGKPGERGAQGFVGKAGARGDAGDDGWSPQLAVVADGERRVHQVVGWIGGDGEPPASGYYLGPDGPVDDIENATDLRGSAGARANTSGGGPLNLKFAAISATPTTLAGYGITDAYTKTETEALIAAGAGADNTIAALAGQNWALNAVPVGTGPDTLTQLPLGANTFLARSSAGNVAAKPITDYGFSLLDDADAATARGTLGLGSAALASSGDFDPAGSAATAQANAQTYADGLVTGLLDDRGNFDASGNVFPASGGSGAAGAILKGDLWKISVAGTLGGTAVNVGDWVRALADAPGQTAGNWALAEGNIGYVPLNAASNLSDLTNAATARGNLGVTATGADTTYLFRSNNLSDLGNAATARGNLGGTTVGQAFFALTNPSAITFPRINADNSVTARSAANYRTDLGLGTGDSPTLTGLTLSGMTAGSVLFAGVGGAIAQDNANLFWDDTNNVLKVPTQIQAGLPITSLSAGAQAYLNGHAIPGIDVARLNPTTVDSGDAGVFRSSVEYTTGFTAEHTPAAIYGVVFANPGAGVTLDGDQRAGDWDAIMLGLGTVERLFAKQLYLQHDSGGVVNHGYLARGYVYGDNNSAMGSFEGWQIDGNFVDAGSTPADGALWSATAFIAGTPVDFLRYGDSLATAKFRVDSAGLVYSGRAGSALGTYNLSGNTSGTISIKPQAAAGTYNFNLPTTAGTSGQVLTSAGGVAAAMTWTTLATSATTDTTNASNISSGTLANARLPAAISITNLDGTLGANTAAAATVTTLAASSDVTVGSNAGTARQIVINRAAGNIGALAYQTAGVNRWLWQVGSGAESGSDVGSAMFLLAYTDAGAQIDAPFTIARAAGGAVTIARPTTVNGGTLTVSGANSEAAWGVAGIGFKTVAATYTDTSSSGTVATAAVNSFGQPTLAASSATTYTNAYTVYIAGPPIAGTNVTLSAARAFTVASGNSLFLGSVTIQGGVVSLNASSNNNVSLCTGTSTGAVNLGGSSATVGFFAVTAVARASAYTQTYATATKTHSNLTSATLTDNTAGTGNTTLEALTSGTVYATDVAAIRNNFADLAKSNNAIIVDLTNLKGVVNSIVDDLQAYGLLQ